MPQSDIMIIDDTPENLKILAGVLKDEGYKVRAVLSGQMALTAAHVAVPDLILLDINMPDMNGYEVCVQFKADPQLQHIPVIFISALAGEVDTVRASEAGAVDYISKPFRFDEVLRKVEYYLQT
ncbi:MAG: response regulator [Chloroflexi bacterium]|nr:response regulator [Chloroflexota bacterium]